MKNLARMMLLGLALSGLASAQDPLSASLALNQGFESTKQFTGSRNGLTVDVAYDLQGSAPVRFGLANITFKSGMRNYAVVNGDGGQDYVPGDGISMNVYQAYAALRTQPLPKLTMSFGLSMNRIRLGYPEGKEMVKGWKGGARLDLDFQITKQVSAILGYQAMEVGLDEVKTALDSPSWLQVGIRYHF